MSIRLKNLYKLLIENRKHEVQGWNKAYKNFYSKVEKIRERIKSGEVLSNQDESFLRELLYNLDNGIASRGQSVLSNQNFIDFIKNRQFLSDLESLIVNPNFETYQVFKKTWSDQGKSNNPVLINDDVDMLMKKQHSVMFSTDRTNTNAIKICNEDIVK